MALVLVVGTASASNIGTGAIKQDEAVALLALSGDRQRQPTEALFVLGGQVFEYSEQDWRGHEESLGDALRETHGAIWWSIARRDERGWLAFLTGWIRLSTLAAELGIPFEPALPGRVLPH